MNTTNVLTNVKVASPCSADWEHMDGNDRVRFCAHCQKNVYNLGSMNTAEITALIQEKEGRLCARFYRRSDGTMLTGDCPVGLRQVAVCVRKLGLGAAALLVFAVMASVGADRRSNTDSSTPPRRLSVLWHEVVWTVKGWLGLQPRIMGEICIPTPGPASTSSNSTSRL